MAATVKIYEFNGASGSGTPVTSAGSRFCSADTPSPGISYPVVKPSDGTINRSYWKTFALYAETSASNINNVKWYTDGAIGWSGITVYVGATSAYTQSTGTPGSYGTDSAVATTAATTYTASAKLSVAGSGTSGRISDYVVLQADVTSGASGGTTAQEIFYWEYDEV